MIARIRIALLLCAAAVAGLASSVPAFAGAQRSGARTVYVDGDSLAVGTSWYLGSDLRGYTLHESVGVSRHVDEGVAAVRSRGAALEHVVVVDLGTNDDPRAVGQFARDVREVVRLAGPTRCVIWPTINRPPYDGVSYDGYNAVLRSLDRRYRSLHVYDWASVARAHPGWFGSDGVHPGTAGYRVRAAGIARLITSC